MDKKTLAIIGVTAVVLVGGAVIFMNISKVGSDNSSTSTNESSQTQPQADGNTQEQVEISQTNAQSLATSGKSQECTFDYDGENGSAEGKMFTDGKGKSRMTISNIQTDQGNTGESNMIIRDNKYYNWIITGGQSFGFSGEVNANTSNDSSQPQASSGQTSPNQNFSMSCKSWNVDESEFEVPANINFSSLNFNLPVGN